MKNHLNHKRAFTLMELMVSVSILVIIILSVGIIFQTTSKAVGNSQAILEMMSNVTSIQQQIDRDVAGIDRDSFLVIRCQFDPQGSGKRFDQISFIANGTFPNRTGTAISNSAVFSDSTIATSAFVWWGQLAIQKTQTSPTPYPQPLVPSVFLNPGQDDSALSANTWLTQVPNGVKDSDFELGRNTILLLPSDAPPGSFTTSASGVPLYAYPSIDFAVANANPFTASTIGEAVPAHIASSRFGVAISSPTQLMQAAQNPGGGVSSNSRFEADRYCYRFATLQSIYDSTEATTGLANGAFRMHPIALQGCSSFAIDWTDGTTYAATDIDLTTVIAPIPPSTTPPTPQTATQTGVVGTTKWYGPLTYPTGTVPLTPAASAIGPIPSVRGIPGSSQGDTYTAIFSFDTPKKNWPKALRFRYHLADPTGRFPNGRDFVQIVQLPPGSL